MFNVNQSFCQASHTDKQWPTSKKYNIDPYDTHTDQKHFCNLKNRRLFPSKHTASTPKCQKQHSYYNSPVLHANLLLTEIKTMI